MKHSNKEKPDATRPQLYYWQGIASDNFVIVNPDATYSYFSYLRQEFEDSVNTLMQSPKRKYYFNANDFICNL